MTNRYLDDDERQMKKAVKKEKDWAQQDNIEIDAAIDALLERHEGRKLLWWLLSIGKVNTQPFAHNALATSFNCGELNVGNQIMARIIEVNSAGYVQMLKEQENESRDRTSNGNASDGDASSDGDSADSYST